MMEVKKGDMFWVKGTALKGKEEFEPKQVALAIAKDGKDFRSIMPKKTLEGYRAFVRVDFDEGDYEFVWRGVVEDTPIEKRIPLKVTDETKVTAQPSPECTRCEKKTEILEGEVFGCDTAIVDKDALNMTETSDYLSVDAVIAREGVFPFEEGRLYRPANILERAALLRTEMPLVFRRNLQHPRGGVVRETSEIAGMAYVEEFKDGKLKGRLSINKKIAPESLVDAVKRGELREVSIGYHHTFEKKPSNWNEFKYDLLETDLYLDHVAIVERGRCSFPICGIGVDKKAEPEVGGDPFGKWKNFEDCVQDQMRRKKLKRENAERLCGWLKHRLEGKK